MVGMDGIQGAAEAAVRVRAARRHMSLVQVRVQVDQARPDHPPFQVAAIAMDPWVMLGHGTDLGAGDDEVEAAGSVG
jgi:hypothetical protein